MAALNATRRALHGVAELVLAGPEYRASGTIRLRVISGGFGTIREPMLRVEHTDLVTLTGSVPIDGRSCAQLAAEANVEAGPPADLYHDGSGVSPNEKLALDRDAAHQIMTSLDIGDVALRRFAPDAPAVLWPEHFDVSATVDDVTYGVSPGDTYLGEPYAYVGPPSPVENAFFDAPFGAARPLRDLGNADSVLSFFTEGARILAAHR
jgi:hypothetical protein